MCGNILLLARPRNPEALQDHEGWVVWYTQPDEPDRAIEGHVTKGQALHAMRNLQDHADRYGHPCVYHIAWRDNIVWQ